MLCVSVRGIAFLLSALTLSAALGCGGGRATLSGDVSYDGAPVDNGTITFVPEGKGERVAAPVIDGKYAFDAEKGPQAGKYKVEVTWNKKSGVKTPNGDGGFNDETKQTLPQKYNKATTLTADVSPSSAKLDFNLAK